MKDLMSTLGYKFQDLTLLRTALTHKSFSSEHNERLEFLGDALLNLYVTEYLYNRFDSLDEGKLTQFKATIVSRENLNKIAQSIGLSNFIQTGKGEGLEGNSIAGNAVEALIGAVYLDKGLNFTEKFILNLWSDHITASVITQIDAKTKLQEYSLKIFKVLPIYKLISNTVPRHKPLFKVAVKLKDTKFFTAEGTSKKEAEQNAASLCFEDVFKK